MLKLVEIQIVVTTLIDHFLFFLQFSVMCWDIYWNIHVLIWASWVHPIYCDICFVLPSASDILRCILSCRTIAIYDLPINLRYIYKRVLPLVYVHAFQNSKYVPIWNGPIITDVHGPGSQWRMQPLTMAACGSCLEATKEACFLINRWLINLEWNLLIMMKSLLRFVFWFVPGSHQRCSWSPNSTDIYLLYVNS